MKKTIALCLALTLALTFSMVSASAEQASGVKLGVSIQTTLTNSSDASADAEGLAQIDTDVVAVLVDANGVILDAYIDSLQSKLPFTAQGKLGANFPTAFQTKIEMGDAYGMAAVSKIGDWDKQIEAFRAYVIGKTAEQVQGIAVDASTRPTGADLTAGCTMAIGSYMSGVVNAIAKAVPTKAAATDKLGLGILSNADRSADAADGTDGVCEAYTYYAAVTVGDTGAVTDCVLDSTQGSVKFDATGKITTDLTAAVPTKVELGDSYGMKKASAIGKEWYEQANAFAAYVIGKTAADIDGIALAEDGKPSGADLTASVTIPAGDFKGTVLKAVSNAK